MTHTNTRSGRLTVATAAAAVGALLLSGCQVDLTGTTAASSKKTVAHVKTDTAASPSTIAAGSDSSGQLRLVQEPADGYQLIYEAFRGAKASIDMTMYELADSTAQADLIAAHKRGVTVRIILDKAFHGQRVNQAAYDQLRAAGVSVRWAPAGQLFHQKTITTDGTHSWIGTGNLTAKYYPTARDAWIADTNPTQVQAIAGTFQADWNDPAHSGNAVGAPGLMWSPGAEQQIVADINTARKTLDFTSEELADTKVVAALSAAAKRGVTCRIVMTDSPDWTPGFTAVTAAGCTVHVYPDSTKALYIHELSEAPALDGFWKCCQFCLMP
jgi:cardiolipin synthase